jgi:hypothetical protein
MVEIKESPKQNPLYLISTHMDRLLNEDGIIFDGETEKDRQINFTDFVTLRTVYQRVEQGLSMDEKLSIIRTLKQMVKAEWLSS